MRSVRTVSFLLAFAAGLHLAAMPSHLSEGAAVGAFFLVVAVVQLAAAALVYRGTGPIVRALIAAGNLGVIAVWAVSRTAGLGGGPEPVALFDGLAVVVELAAVAGLCLGSATRPARQGLTGLPALAVVALLVAGAGLPFAPAAHSHAEAGPGQHDPAADHHHDGIGHLPRPQPE